MGRRVASSTARTTSSWRARPRAQACRGFEPPEQLSHSGTRVLTVDGGTITLHVTGVFDTQATSNLDFAELSRVTGGTGIFSGASGVIWAYGMGVAHPDGSMTFNGHMKGRVCGVAEHHGNGNPHGPGCNQHAH